MAPRGLPPYTSSMRSSPAWLLAALLAAPALPAFAGAPPDEGVTAAAAASTPQDAEAQAGEGDEADQEARLTEVTGAVYVHLPGHGEDEYARAEPDMPVAAGDEIRVGDDSSAELTLEGHTVIHIGPNSDFIVNSLAPEATEFHLGLGSIVAKIKHLVDGRRMEFRTPTTLAAVRGTELGVAQGGDGEPARVGVFDEGDVAVSGTARPGEIHIGPNQEVRVEGGRVGRPAAMSFFNAHRARLERARSRQRQMLAGAWRPRPLAERRQRRAMLLQRKALKRAELQGLSPQQRQRQYRALRQRQKALRRQARAQRRQNSKQMKPQREQMRQQRQEQRQERMDHRKARRGQKAQAPQPPPQRRWQAAGPGERRRERPLRGRRR
jgi:hypothetical protein